MPDTLHYASGFGNTFSSEAIAHALPLQQNNPQKVPFGLYAEQLSGDAFTVDRRHNRRTWLYRIFPSAKHSDHIAYAQPLLLSPPFAKPTPPTQFRWQPLPYAKNKQDFIDSLVTYAGHGNPSLRTGCAIHLYAANSSMTDRFFENSDGDFMIVPQEGRLLIKTEFGHLQIEPQEIAVIQRGMKFQVILLDSTARGYIAENFGQSFELPNLGPLGPNSLAEPRHFLTPTAAYEDKAGKYQLITKFEGHLWSSQLDHSPLDVVAWHGNYVPYKYDLRLFTAVFSVTWDHTDPSVFTVMTSPSAVSNVANLDFVIFPSRWMVMNHTMRIPYYHRNTMSEFMGLITGQYDAKTGFVAGGASLHNCMSGHGPDAESYQKAISVELQPEYYQNTLAFMFESYYPWQLSPFALETNLRDTAYTECWQQLPKTFNVK